MPTLKQIPHTPPDGKTCLRCGVTKKQLRKNWWGCKVWGEYFGRHLYK